MIDEIEFQAISLTNQKGHPAREYGKYSDDFPIFITTSLFHVLDSFHIIPLAVFMVQLFKFSEKGFQITWNDHFKKHCS
jgi:hypothetical protein